MAKKLENMSIEELDAAIHETAVKRRALKQEALTYQARIDTLKAQAKVEAMTSAEKAALAQTIRAAGGIESLEALGEPGA